MPAGAGVFVSSARDEIVESSLRPLTQLGNVVNHYDASIFVGGRGECLSESHNWIGGRFRNGLNRLLDRLLDRFLR